MKIVSPYYEEAYIRNGVMGFYTQGIKNRAEAINALKNYIEKDDDEFLEEFKKSYGKDFVFDERNVRESKYQTHKACGMMTVDGDGECVECFDYQFTSGGRISFIYKIK